MPEGGNGALTAQVCSVVYLEKEKNVGRKLPIGAGTGFSGSYLTGS